MTQSLRRAECQVFIAAPPTRARVPSLPCLAEHFDVRDDVELPVDPGAVTARPAVDRIAGAVTRMDGVVERTAAQLVAAVSAPQDIVAGPPSITSAPTPP